MIIERKISGLEQDYDVAKDQSLCSIILLTMKEIEQRIFRTRRLFRAFLFLGIGWLPNENVNCEIMMSLRSSEFLLQPMSK